MECNPDGRDAGFAPLATNAGDIGGVTIQGCCISEESKCENDVGRI